MKREDMDHEWTDRSLFDACRNEGSIEQGYAFESLHRDLYRIAHFMIGSTNYPDREAMAKDCAQEALEKVWRHLHTCRNPDKFRSWAKAVVRHHTLNELIKQQRRRELSLELEEHVEVASETISPDKELEQRALQVSLLDVMARAPMSQRSKRVVLGRYLEEKRDSQLAEEVSEAEGLVIRPSHIQVTRAKDLKRLREDEGVRIYLQAWM